MLTIYASNKRIWDHSVNLITTSEGLTRIHHSENSEITSQCCSRRAFLDTFRKQIKAHLQLGVFFINFGCTKFDKTCGIYDEYLN